MFLDTTSISDSTLSSSASQQPHSQPPASPSSSLPPAASINRSKEPEYKPLAVNEPLNRQKRQCTGKAAASSSPRVLSPTHHNHTATQASDEGSSSIKPQTISLESYYLGIKSWLGASVGAFWATLSFINHFIESRLIRGLLIPAGASFRSLLDNILAGDNRQPAWREARMISFHSHHNQQSEQQYSGTNPEYLNDINRARKWSEETALVLKEIASYEFENNNNSWHGSHGSLLYNNSSNNISELENFSAMDQLQQHRGRVARRAGSEYLSHTPAGSLSTPLALPLHSIACPQTSYPDALQIQRNANAYEVPACSSGATTTTTNTAPEVRRGPCGSAQKQEQKTPTDFQGQQNTACCSSSLKAESASARDEQGYARQQQQQHKHHDHENLEQQQQQQRYDQTPLEQRLGLSRALLGMQKRKNLLEWAQQTRTTNGEDGTSVGDPLGTTSRSGGREFNQINCGGGDSNEHHLVGDQSDARSASSMVLVSKSTLNNLTEQIAFSMNKMRDLEEKVSVIPELQRRLHNVISDTTSSSSITRGDSRSSSIAGIRDSKYNLDNNNDYLDHHANCTTSGNTRRNNFSRRSSLNDGHDLSPYKTMFSSSLRQPYGGSMRYSPGYRAASNLISHHQQQSAGTDSLARASSFSLSSPYKQTNGQQRYFDELARGASNITSGNHGNSRQSLDMSNALRSTHDNMPSLNSSSNLVGPSSTSKVEYEDLINDLISLSYSVNYLSSSNSNSNSAHSQSSSNGAGDNHSASSSLKQQVEETHGNKLEAHDAIRTSKTKRQINVHSKSSNNKHVISSTQPSSTKATYQQQLHSTGNQNHNYNHLNLTFNSSMNHLYSNNHHHAKDSNTSHHSTSYLSRNFNGSGSLSLQTTPVKTQLDCGCQSFKEHLRYNSISREQRINGAKSHQVISSLSNNSSTNASPQPQVQLASTSQKADATTNTDLSMDELVTKSELNKLVDDIRKTYSSLSHQVSNSISQKSQPPHNNNSTRNISTSPMSDSSSGSATGPNSSSQTESQSSSSGDDRFEGEEASDDNLGLKTNSSASVKDISDEMSEPKSGNQSPDVKHSREQEDDDEEDEIEVNLNSIDGAEEAYSLGSSYQDPSDFEEYCAYGESLDRRTKDFMSQTTKIPNDLRFALIRLNDSIKKERPFSQIESSSNCIDVIRKEWFEVAASKDAQAIKTKLYVDFFESFTKQLLNTVVNLADSAGNTAMHYAASHFKLDIIEILLDTKVCDVNCRNKAGYTPIMLLALAELEELFEQEVARHLFSMGDVNVKARSSGQTALMLAASHGRVATCKLLLECGADPSLQDFDGSTALMCGSELGNEEVVRCLLAHKLTDPNATDNDGLDALTIAMNNGHKSIGLILYAAKNVPRMTRSAIQHSSNPRLIGSAGSNYLGASLRRSRGKSVVNHVRRADSLLGQRHARSARQLEYNNV